MLDCARVDTSGAHFGPVTLAVRAIGRGDAVDPLDAAAVPRYAGDEVLTTRAAGVVEWWRDVPGGLEHGVTIAARPSGDGPLVVEVATDAARTELLPADEIALRDERGVTLATYAHLFVLDADHAAVPARLLADGHSIRIEIDDTRARYPLVIDPVIILNEEWALFAPDGATVERFGWAVGLSSDASRALVGMAWDTTPGGGTRAGSARVFLRTGASWAQEATLLAPDGASPDQLGSSVALSSDGSRAIVGAPWDETAVGSAAGTARVFLRTGTSWAQQATLVAPDADVGDLFGTSVALSTDGSVAVVGANWDDTPGGVDAGSARVFVRTGTTWAQEATLLASGGAANDQLGFAVAISADGSRALVGAWLDDTAGGASAGSGRVFVRSGTTWAEEAVLVASDGSADDDLGTSVALSADGSLALLGSPLDNTTAGADAGSVRVFVRTGTSWTAEATLLASGAAAGDHFGSSVALRADASGALIGASTDDTAGGTDAGSARAFLRSGTSWAEATTLLASAGAAGDRFGNSVALCADGSRGIVGALLDDAAGGTDAGSARVFTMVAGDPDGTACATGARCRSDLCVDGVCCDSACPGGAFDCQACTAALTGGANGTCAPLSASVAPTITCRAAAGACDPAETCTSVGTSCPADAIASAGTLCRAQSGECDVAETCSGASAVCPADVAATTGFVCRPSTGACDDAEVCDGASASCPGDMLAPSGRTCRSMLDACDAPETCTGTSASCPVDGFAPGGTMCRSPVGPCDAADVCTGASASCPDAFVPADVVCNAAVTGVCDVADRCTGASVACPATFLADVLCRPATGACDAPELCDGDAPNCPPDATLAGAVCRPSTDPSCDPAESCDGVAASCPADARTCASTDGGPGIDAAVGSDASASDASAASDAASMVPVAAAGCACRASVPRDGARPMWLALVGLVLGFRLRRRQRPRTSRRGIVLVGCLAVLLVRPTDREPRVVVVAIPLGYHATVGPRGAVLSVARGAYEVVVGLRSIGRQGTLRALSGDVEVERSGAEIHLRRAPGIVEWWRSLPTGLEQGVTLEARPPGSGPLLLEMTTGVNVRANDEGDGVALLVGERRIARYDHLSVRDAAGRLVPARLIAAGEAIRIEVEDGDARYPLVVDPLLVATQEALLTAPAPASDHLGASVSLSADGSRALVGAPNAAGYAGEAHVFVRVGSTWTHEATLTAVSTAPLPQLGSAVALSADGSRALVGAPGDANASGVEVGSVRSYVRTGSSWAPEATLFATAGAADDDFGSSIALTADASRAVVGADNDDTAAGIDAGSVRVFLRVGSTWSAEATIVASGAAAGDRYGSAVAIAADGSRAIVGVLNDTTVAGGASTGTARVVSRTGTTWVEEAILEHASPATGDHFGWSVALSSDASRALVGAPDDDTTWGASGSAHVFRRSGTAWSSEAVFTATGFGSARYRGKSAALSADGSRAFFGTSDSNVLFFARTGTTWAEQGPLLPSGGSGGGWFGYHAAVASDGSRAIVGAELETIGATTSAGSARVFVIVAAAPNGAACSASGSCLSDACVDGFCCDLACGAGATNDCQACSAALTGALDGTCAPLRAAIAPTVVCRVAGAALCDVADTCTSASTTCPDGVAGAGTVCRPAATPCDAAEQCTGASDTCPVDRAAATGAPCRPSAGACDPAEACDGASFACPGDGFGAPGSLCRGATSQCDAEERCTGVSGACPVDGFQPAGVSCRPPAGACDALDVCSGTSADCPDTFLMADVVCNAAVAGACDTPDRCTGSTTECPQTFLAAVECRASGGPCDLAETCSGDAPGCPADLTLAAGVECRASTGATCDPAETCDGVAVTCPLDNTTCDASDGGATIDGGLGLPDGSASDAMARDGDSGVGAVATAGCACRAGRSARAPAHSIAALGMLAALARSARRRRSMRRGCS